MNDPIAPWLSVDAPDNDFSLVNFNNRYRDESDPVDWRSLLEGKENLRFIGLPDEYELFLAKFGVRMEYIPTTELLAAAKLIKGCRVFIGNQSSCLTMAVGLGKRVVVETTEDYPNCIFVGRESQFYGASQATIEQYGVRVSE